MANKKVRHLEYATIAVTFLSSLVSALMLRAQQKVDIHDTVKETLKEERRQIYEAQMRRKNGRS